MLAIQVRQGEYLAADPDPGAPHVHFVLEALEARIRETLELVDTELGD